MRLKTLASLPLFALLTSCYYLQSTSIPIKTIHYTQSAEQADKSTRQLMVLLPGIGDRAGVFDKYGVIDAIHIINPNMDVIAVDAHFKYYEARTINDRLRQDIIKPALDAGYGAIYLGGTSLGGFGSLLYLKQHPNDIDKIFILAPYLGDAQDYNYLLENTAAPQVPRDVNLWPWLIQLPDETKNKIYLAYGINDKFAIPNGLLEKQLPPEHTVTQTGKHNWKTWAQLWPRLLEKPKMLAD
ncbi:alpha/beta fold hydrolase [Cellvibrio sp. OA-2007]|uniref:alpha/beta fold hydrolase n=1 Tax=Cellvibrio sp. OA-2007 TaxID=529823 RepID=UPI000AFDDD3B|nr:alpha/beta hydrolase [Cellvibrio sp. OA-2007]